MAALTRILVVDDEESLRHMLSLTLSQQGYAVTTAANADEALAKIRTDATFELCLTDVRMPGTDGLSFIALAQQQSAHAPTFIAMSAYGDEQLAIEALQRGAFDYISKPFESKDLLLRLRLLKMRRREVAPPAHTQGSRAKESAPITHGGFATLISADPQMLALIRTAEKVAAFPTTVLLTGETGTGKERMAVAIHHGSPRSKHAFVAVNCAAIPENLLENELFGHRRGAFTDAHEDRPGLFEMADGGTLFLDEIAELSPKMQVKLLRVLEEGCVRRLGETKSVRVDARLIAATSRPLQEYVDDGRFREDLYFRLNVVALHLPPLRERRADIVPLLKDVLQRLGVRLQIPSPKLSPEAEALLFSYYWPGNIRELENVLERALVLSEHPTLLDVDDFDLRFRAPGPVPPQGDTASHDDLSFKHVLPRIEKELIEKALEETNGHRAQAAERLGISTRTLLYKLKEYGLGT